MSSTHRFAPADERSALLRALVDSSDDAIIAKGLDGTIVSWNAGAERSYGYTVAEAIGKPIALIVPDDLRDEQRGILDEIRAGRRVASHETVRMTRDGRRVPISLTVSPILDAAGRVVGASAIGRDITAGKRAAEHKMRLSNSWA